MTLPSNLRGIVAMVVAPGFAGECFARPAGRKRLHECK